VRRVNNFKKNHVGTVIVVIHKDRAFATSAGYSDDLHCFKDGDLFIIAVENKGLGYLGVEVFDTEGKTEDIFLYEWELEQLLGKNHNKLTTLTKVKRMLAYFIG
jgi:hypothetical protein